MYSCILYLGIFKNIDFKFWCGSLLNKSHGELLLLQYNSSLSRLKTKVIPHAKFFIAGKKESCLTDVKIRVKEMIANCPKHAL